MIFFLLLASTPNFANSAFLLFLLWRNMQDFTLATKFAIFVKSHVFKLVGSSRVSRQTSWSDSKSRTVSVASGGYVADGAASAPMMKIIGQLWCHECTRMFADRLVSSEGKTTD